MNITRVTSVLDTVCARHCANCFKCVLSFIKPGHGRCDLLVWKSAESPCNTKLNTKLDLMDKLKNLAPPLF